MSNDIVKRLIRVETKLSTLMQHMGMDPSKFNVKRFTRLDEKVLNHLQHMFGLLEGYESVPPETTKILRSYVEDCIEMLTEAQQQEGTRKAHG